MRSTDSAAAAAPFARVWDLPVRLFHWLLVALLGFSWWSGKQHLMDWHRLSGYGILALLVFRIYWGFAGGRTARFAQFVRGPVAAVGYLRTLGKGTGPAMPGHNPIGGWSVLAMLATLMTMVAAGLFAVDIDGVESGPLADYVNFDQGRVAADIHAWAFDVLLALVALHVLAIAFYLVGLGNNLIAAMITGRGRSDEASAIDHGGASPWRAVIGVIAAAFCAVAVARGFRF